MALAALAACDGEVRRAGYGALSAVMSALPESSFKEKAQLAMLLHG